MNARTIVLDWEKRLVNVEKKISDACFKSVTNQAVLSTWKKRDTFFADISLMKEVAKKIGFDEMHRLIREYMTESDTVAIWARMEEAVQVFEKDFQVDQSFKDNGNV